MYVCDAYVYEHGRFDTRKPLERTHTNRHAAHSETLVGGSRRRRLINCSENVGYVRPSSGGPVSSFSLVRTHRGPHAGNQCPAKRHERTAAARFFRIHCVIPLSPSLPTQNFGSPSNLFVSTFRRFFHRPTVVIISYIIQYYRATCE